MNWLTIPNAFTFLRILMTPLITLQLAHGRWMSGGWLLGGAAFTDLLDGGLARRFGWYSKAGLYLDPVADKLLLTCVYIGLAIASAVPTWLLCLILGRDVWILAMSAIALKFTAFRDLNPSIWGKFSTFAQVMTAVAIIGARAYNISFYQEAASWMIWVVAALAIISCAVYTWRGIHYMRKGEGPFCETADSVLAPGTVDLEQTGE